MKRRYLVFLVFFMFLYIGPVNLLPYDVPPTIVQRPQEPTLENFVVATDLDVVLAHDNDDDYWKTLTVDPWTVSHITGETLYYQAYYVFLQQRRSNWRFQLTIPQGSTITSANLSLYIVSVSEAAAQSVEIRRIDETSVGSLEDDEDMPAVVETNKATFDNDGQSAEYQVIDVTDMVQDQVNIEAWSSGNYMGFGMNNTAFAEDSFIRFEDFSHGDLHHSYMNITYSGEEEEVGWLDGWNRRKSHIIDSTAGTGVDYEVPFWVFFDDGTDTGNTVFLNGNVREDFADVRWTASNGTTLLDFNLNETITHYYDAFYVDDTVKFAHYPANYPAAWFYNDRTYVVIHGPNGADESSGDPYIRYYDHETSLWSDRVKIADTPLSGDDHGAPCLFVNSTGHIHVFYGSHNSPVKHAVSDNAEDITSWTVVDDVFDSGDGATYPHVSYDPTNNVVHAYVRGDDGSDQHLRYYNSSDGGHTWNEGQVLMNVNSGQIFPYMEGAGGIDPYDSDLLHITWTEYNVTAESNYQDVFYIYVDVSTGLVYNVSGNSQGYNITTRTELDNCKVYDTGGAFTWGPSVHVDSDSKPYIIWTQETAQSNNESTRFSYWTGAAWSSAVNVSWPYKVAAPSDFIVHASDNITAFLGDQKNMARFTWNGATWTNEEVIHIAPAIQPLTFAHVPHGTPTGIGGYDDVLQVIFTERFGGDKGWAWGANGLLKTNTTTKAKFYVTIPTNLSESAATIYIYYDRACSSGASQQLDYDIGNDPDHSTWGEEETGGNSAPINEQTPVVTNPDDTDNLYAQYKEYKLTANVSDVDSALNISYLEISLYSNDRITLYWTIRFTEDTDTFSEQSDTSNMISLNVTGSTNSTSGNTLNVTFVFTVHWNHTDTTDTDIEQTVFDNWCYSDTDFYEIDYDVETRLDFSTFLLDDGSGTVDRGDYDTLDGIIASGTIDYYGSAISPDTEEVDVWVSCSDVEGGPWSDTTLVDGVFSVTVDSDNVVGLDTYSFIVVEKDEGVGGSDLSHTSHSDTYIADRLIVDIQADDETPFNDQQVNFTLTIIYDYDDTVCSTYTIIVSRNAVEWYTFINGNKTLFNDTNSDVAYVYTTYDISESTHGLTKYSSGSESVTWSGAATTTTITFPTTTAVTTDPESGIFYELFLSLDMWGYLGPLAIVIVGYILAKKDRGLGLIAFMVQCLIAAQYFALVATTPAYWWHIYIILFGGLFSCVIPLIDR